MSAAEALFLLQYQKKDISNVLADAQQNNIKIGVFIFKERTESNKQHDMNL